MYYFSNPKSEEYSYEKIAERTLQDIDTNLSTNYPYNNWTNIESNERTFKQYNGIVGENLKYFFKANNMEKGTLADFEYISKLNNMPVSLVVKGTEIDNYFNVCEQYKIYEPTDLKTYEKDKKIFRYGCTVKFPPEFNTCGVILQTYIDIDNPEPKVIDLGHFRDNLYKMFPERMYACTFLKDIELYLIAKDKYDYECNDVEPKIHKETTIKDIDAKLILEEDPQKRIIVEDTKLKVYKYNYYWDEFKDKIITTQKDKVFNLIFEGNDEKIFEGNNQVVKNYIDEVIEFDIEEHIKDSYGNVDENFKLIKTEKWQDIDSRIIVENDKYNTPIIENQKFVKVYKYNTYRENFKSNIISPNKTNYSSFLAIENTSHKAIEQKIIKATQFLDSTSNFVINRVYTDSLQNDQDENFSSNQSKNYNEKVFFILRENNSKKIVESDNVKIVKYLNDIVNVDVEKHFNMRAGFLDGTLTDHGLYNKTLQRTVNLIIVEDSDDNYTQIKHNYLEF